MSETNHTQNNSGGVAVSELLSERWSVVSFDKCEASGLTYPHAAQRMAKLDAQRVAGLCIITDEAAARLSV